MSDQYGIRPHQVVGYEYVPPNILMNGGLNIWQRGNGPFITDIITQNRFTADEWLLAGYPATVTNTGTSLQFIGNVGMPWVGQSPEFYKALEGLTLTFSADVKASVASTQLIISDWTGVPNAAATNHPGDGAWHRLTTVKQIRSGLIPTGGMWPHSFGILIYVSTTGTIEFKNAICVVGNYPEGVPYTPFSRDTDRKRCQRFYEVGTNFYRSYGPPGSICHTTLPYKVNKYASPTVGVTFTPGVGGSTGSVAVGPNPLTGITTTMTNGVALGDFSGTFSWTAAVP